jgi:PAS domain S-box-containing protein
MSADSIRRLARALAQPVTYLGVAMLVAIYCTLTYLLISDRQEAAADAARRGGNIVRIIEQSFSHILKSADASLLFLRKSYQLNPSNFDLAAWARDPSISNELTFDFGIADAKGRVIDTSFSKHTIGDDRSGHEVFRVHADSTADELFISRPMIVKSSGKSAIMLSRRIAASDGVFAGVIVAYLDPGQLAKQIGALDLGPDGTFALVGFDGFMRTRAVSGVIDWESIGKQFPPRAGVLGYAAREKSGTYWNTPGLIGNVSRLVSYRVLESFPLVVLVSISETEVYRRANENARIYWGISLLLTVAIAIAVGFGARREQKLIAATSQMQQAQQALAQSQERYTLVEAAVNDGLWDWNIQTGEAYMSPRWKNILGYADDELPNVASSFFDLLHPDDKAAMTEAVRADLEESKPYPSLDIRLRCKTGDYRWVLSRGKVLRDASNSPVRMLGTITDISERKQAEALVEESRSNLARAETMALLGHFKRDLVSSVGFWSEGHYRIMGKSPESFTPTTKAVLELVHPDDRPIFEQHRREVIEGVKSLRTTLRWIKDDGQIIYAESWSAPILASDGRVTGMFGTIQDITARKQAEEGLAQANAELEARVAERTAALAQEMRAREQAQMALAQVQKMEAVGQLTAGIAHDFNNLLAVIGGGLEFVEAAAARGVTAEPELIDAALRATRRGRDLVQRLLSFSRQAPLQAEPTAIDQLVLDTLRLLQRTLGEEIEIVTNLDAMAAAVAVDRNQLVNALLNLALNARDAMPAGGQLTIATVCQPAPSAAEEGSARWPTGEEVCITVSDTGAGMIEAVREHVFEPFFTTKVDGLGSGLGLSMVHGFVQQSGGHIEIDSALGRGTTVSIRLPRIDVVSQAAEPEAGVSALAKEKTVLLVEDDPDVRIMTAAQLKQLGYKVHAVANGMEAIDVIASPAKIDITLTDIVLPGGLDGVALVKEAMRARPAMGVLCMSGYDPTREHRKWLAVQNIELLEKPFSSSRLAQALDAVLAH